MIEFLAGGFDDGLLPAEFTLMVRIYPEKAEKISGH
jgi:hypothetical protein